MSTYYSATHTPRQHKRGRGKRRAVIITSVVGVVVLAAGIAIAMVLLRSPVTGSVSTVNQQVGWYSAVTRGSAPLTVADGATCTLEYGATQQAPITISMTNAWPGATCQFAPGFKVYSGEDVHLLAFEIDGLPEGWSAYLHESSPCGFKFTLGGSGFLLRFVIEVGEDAALASGSHPITANAVTVPVSQWDAGACTAP